MKIDTKSIGRRIRSEREGLALSREEFAEIIGLSSYYVGQLERGERQMSLDTLIKIANCLHISLDYLIFGTSSKNIYYIHETSASYEENKNNLNVCKEINYLLNKCSPKELNLFKKLIKTILPYLRKS